MKKYLKQLKANKKGFTLIEMIVVIAIIGILAAILVPSMAGYLRNAKQTRMDANAKTVYTAAQAAVTSLESTTLVTDGTYTYDGTDIKLDGTEVASESVGEKLYTNISNLMGETNYNKFAQINLTVEDGAVTKVVVQEEGAADTTEYPKEDIEE